MVNFDPTFRHNLLQITIRNGISYIEKHSVQDHGSGIVAAFKINRHVLILTLEFKRRRLPQVTKQAHILKVCDRTLLRRLHLAGLYQMGEVYARS